MFVRNAVCIDTTKTECGLERFHICNPQSVYKQVYIGRSSCGQEWQAGSAVAVNVAI